MGRVIGIDLGTTNSAVAYLEKGQTIIIPNSRGNRVTPSIVAFNKKGEILVGEAAKNQLIINAGRTISHFKRNMGSTDPYAIDHKEYLPQVISSFLLSKLKEDAEKFLGDKVEEAVITVPAYFSDAQRQATVDAGKIAGLNVLRIINEPTAASLAYGLQTFEDQTIMVYDLGGGTFDVSILELEEGVFEVISTRGNNSLGGMDFDRVLCDEVIKQFKAETGIDLSEDKLACQKLFEEVEKAKIALSVEYETQINIPFISADKDGPRHLQFDITRSEFELLIEHFIDETIELSKAAIEDAGIEISEIDKILLVGGSTRIPLVVQNIEKFLNQKIYTGINPDEVVAAGAAIQTGIIKGDVTNVVLADITPLSLGVEVEGDKYVPIIKRNSPIPTGAKKIFTTTVDNQDEVEIHVLQGERKLASENISLGKFILSQIRQAKKGVPRIEVHFDIDVNSIVHVTAKDIDTGMVQVVEINSRVGFSNDEIELFIEDARKYKERDDEILKFNIIKNDALKLVGRIQKLLVEKEIEETFHSEILKVIDDINNLLEQNDTDMINDKINILRDFYDELLLIGNQLQEEHLMSSQSVN